MAIRAKTIFIGPEQLSRMIEKNRPDLEFIATFGSIDAFYDALESGEVSNEVDVIFTLDKSFDPKGHNTEFERMIATYSPFCLFLIIQYNPKVENILRERIDSMESEVRMGDAEFYFVSTSSPNPDIDKARSTYINRHPDAQVSLALQGLEEQEEEALVPEEREVIPGVDNLPGSQEEGGNERLGKVISVTSSKGGSGVTTVATLLSTYIAHAGSNAAKGGKSKAPKVCLLDLNLRNGQLGFVIGTLRPSIMKLRSDGATPETLRETVVHNDGLKVDCLLLPQKPTIAEALTVEFINDLIDLLKSQYDYVVVDAGTSFVGTESEVARRVIFPVADLIVYVTDCSSTSLLSMARWIETVKAPVSEDGMNVPTDKIGIVVNDFISDLNLSGDQIVKLSRGLPVIASIDSNKRLVIKATNYQRIQAVLKDEGFRDSYRKIAEAIVGGDFEMSNDVL